MTDMQTTIPFRTLLLAIVYFFSEATVVFAQEGIQPEDYYKTIFLSQPEISPNGNLVAFTRTVIKEEDNSRHREVWMQKLKNGQPDGEPFRFTDATVQSSNPRWSPDGKLLSIQSRRGDNAESVRFIRVTAPGGEAFTLEGVDRTPVWSRDGQKIAFLREPEREEDLPERAGWIAPDAITNTLDSTRFDGRVITQMQYKSDGTSDWLPHPSIRDKRQLNLVPSEGGDPRKITDLPFHAGEVEWSAGGSRIYFSGDPEEDDEYNTDLTRNIYLVDTESGDWHKVIDADGSQQSPKISPNGRYLAYLNTVERGAQTNIKVLPLNGRGEMDGDPVNLTADWDLAPGNIQWTLNNRTIRFTAQIRGDAHLFEVDREGGAVRQVTEGERRLSSFSKTKDGGYMTYTATDAVTPDELYISRPDGSREVQLTSFNEEWMAERTLNPAEQVLWTVEDGTEIEGWVVKPVDYEPGTSYPMVMKIHGGPHTAYGNTWFQAFHVLSASGMFVFYPNPRGSSAYGHDFMYATRGQWGFLDEEDFMTGIDAVLEKYPDIDSERIGVSGGSYGGFMTNWLTARFPGRFAAAATSRSISNWESFYGTSDVPQLLEFEFFGYPWEKQDEYRAMSPLSYVENVKAPTLIIHSEEDYRTPMPEGEQWYMYLKKREVPVEFVRYPRSSHGLSRTGEPWLLVDRLERIRSWFDYWLDQ